MPYVLIGLCLIDFVLNQSLAKSVIALTTTALCIFCQMPSGDFLNREKLLSQVGEWSYGLYLLHVPIGCWLLLRPSAWFREYSPFARIAGGMVILAACIALSWLFFKWVERP